MTSALSTAEAIFLALATVEPEARSVFLDERCAGQPHLRAEVDAMLAMLDAPGEHFLDPATIPVLSPSGADGPLQPGSVLDGFLVLHAIGSGGMGVVYAAQQEQPRRTVAIKVLRRGLRHPELVRRFEREAEVLARLQHPGIASIFAFHPGGADRPAYLVMELLSGPPITEYVQAEQLDAAACLRLMIEVCDAVQHAHDRGVIHRDLKPANVLVCDGRPRVLDFGIARVRGTDFHTMQTSHGQLLGTVGYMSPEQLRGSAGIDHRTDVYALGVMAYRLLAGCMPADGRPLGEIDAALAGPIERVVARAMTVAPGHRYQSASTLAADLRACLDGGPLSLEEIPSPPVVSALLIAESQDRSRIAVALRGGQVLLLDGRTGAKLAEWPGDGTPVIRLAFSTDATLLVTRATGASLYPAP